MDPLSYPLEELIPHRGTMKLVDKLVSFDAEEESAVVEFTVKDKFQGSQVAIEYMAQSAAVLAGIFDKIEHPEKPPRIGFLMGSRKLKLDIPEFEVGRTYRVNVKKIFSDENTGSFDAAIMDGEKLLASAILNAYRP